VDERFIPLAAFVRAASRRAAPAGGEAGNVPPADAAGGAPARRAELPQAELAHTEPRHAQAHAEPPRGEPPHAEIVRELVLMRLAALEAYERARSRLLESLARDVLARELELAPADIAALAKRALEAFAEHEPLTLVLAPQDAGRVAAALPVRVDSALEPGDLVVEVRDGEIESRFLFRARGALEAAAGAA
jgi:hypothetical protein